MTSSNKRLLGTTLCIISVLLLLCAAVRDNPMKIQELSKQIGEYHDNALAAYRSGGDDFGSVYNSYMGVKHNSEKYRDASIKKQEMIVEGCILCCAGTVSGIAGITLIKKGKENRCVEAFISSFLVFAIIGFIVSLLEHKK